MANTATKLSAGPHHLSYLLETDGSGATLTVASATLLADMDTGPLKTLWTDTTGNQAALRAGLLDYDPGFIAITPRTLTADTPAEVNQAGADVDVDAVTATRAELNLQCSATAGNAYIVTLRYMHSLID